MSEHKVEVQSAFTVLIGPDGAVHASSEVSDKVSVQIPATDPIIKYACADLVEQIRIAQLKAALAPPPEPSFEERLNAALQRRAEQRAAEARLDDELAGPDA